MVIINISILIIIFDILMIFGYNIDTNDPVILKYHNSSYFGYSIILHKYAMIVGAPKDNYSIASVSHTLPHEPGAAWKYIFKTGEWKQIRPIPTDEIGVLKGGIFTTLIMKKNGWFGASISIQDNSNALTICAPRTIISFIALIEKQKYKSQSMHGVCYNGNIISGNFQIEDPNLSSYDFSVTNWFHPLCGFSLHYPTYLTFNHSNNNGKMIVGCPKHQFVGSVRIDSDNASVLLSKTDELTQFGYVVSSGHFFHRDKLLYVGGAPGLNLTGQVGIIDSIANTPIIIYKLNGTTIGEYFGSSLAVGDLNNDGLDDLIIGAPHWGNDNGRVYIYLGHINGFSMANIILNGYLDDSMFGYSITSGDLDLDGFDDLIVGAPYENDGAIYIYNGDKYIDQTIEKSYQRVIMYSRIKTFGYSLAKPIDIDNNGFADIGVGAYKSGHAIILKSRPVIKTDIDVSTVPLFLYQNTTEFVINICVKHIERNLTILQSFNLQLNIDNYFKRVDKTQLTLEYIPSDNITNICLNTTVNILDNIKKSYYDPIKIVVIHKFNHVKRLSDKNIVECKLCPIEMKGVLSKINEISIPFDLNCGLDEICSSSIELHANFDRDESAWIIGSDDITLEIYVNNNGEPAYSTQIIVEMPRDISLRSYFPLCDKYRNSNGILIMLCNISNPLLINHKEKIEFILDMSQLNDGTANGTYLYFNVTVKTQSDNIGMKNISTSLLLLSHIVTAIEGSAEDRNYYYTMDKEMILNLNFQHNYEILKSGSTPINIAKFNVDVPVKFDNSELIVLNDKPNIYINGKMYECYVLNIRIRNNNDNIYSVMSNIRDDNELRRTRNINEQSQKLSSILYKSKYNSEINDEIINIDCLSFNVTCGKIICDLPMIKNKKDIVTLQLQLSINLKLLNDKKFYSNNIIEFITQGWIDIIKPHLESRKITKVRTIFRRIEQLKRVHVWIIIGSILLGLLVLFIVAIILWMLGFFRREKKDALESLRTKNNTGNLT